MPNTLKERLKNQELIIGGWITLQDPFISEIMASHDKVDCIVIDTEHTSLTIHDVAHHIKTISNIGKPPIVRLENISKPLLKKVLDLGCYNIILPMVKSIQDIEECYKYGMYPPDGERETGIFRAQKYGNADDLKAYIKNFKQSFSVIPMIECKAAIEQIESICSSPLVEAIIIGKYDLSSSLGCPGEIDHPEVINAISKVKQSCQKHKCSLGIHQVEPNPSLIDSYINDGFNFIFYGTDFRFIRASLDKVPR